MASFDSNSFSDTTAFSDTSFDFDAAPVVTVVDTGSMVGVAVKVGSFIFAVLTGLMRSMTGTWTVYNIIDR